MKKKCPLVSILITSFNKVKKYIYQAINLINQNIKNLK